MNITFQIQTHLCQKKQLIDLIQVLSNEQLLDKVVINTHPVFWQQILKQRNEPTKIRRVQVVRVADNSLQCKVSGRKLPSTHRGELDLEQLAREMSSRQWVW